MTTMNWRRSRLAAIGAVAATVLAAAPAVAEPTPTARAAASALQPGTCVTSTYKELMGDTLDRPAVDCSSPHNGWVVGRGELPKGLAGAARLDRMDAGCEKSMRKAVGRGKNWARTAYLGYFAFDGTTASPRDYVCLLTVHGGKQPLTTTMVVPPRVSTAPDDSIAMCSTRKGFLTACSQPHAFRTTAVLTLPAKKFRTEQQVWDEATHRCWSEVAVESRYRAWIRMELKGRIVVSCMEKTTR